jgi:hypothetical protein
MCYATFNVLRKCRVKSKIEKIQPHKLMGSVTIGDSISTRLRFCPGLYLKKFQTKLVAKNISNCVPIWCATNQDLKESLRRIGLVGSFCIDLK